VRPFARAGELLLGSRVEPPPELAAGALPDGVVLRRGGVVPRVAGMLARMGGPAAAVTLRSTIVLSSGARLTGALLAHELVHVRQWSDDPLFPLRYIMATLRYGYWNNPYEIEARAAHAPAGTSSSDQDQT
jgi:hypothetical protein